MDIITYNTKRKMCDSEPSRLVHPDEKGIIVKGIESNVLWALLENTTFFCRVCGRKTDIVDDGGDVVMLVRHRRCGMCYADEREDL